MKYPQVANQILAHIQQQGLPYGSKMPSLRQLCQQFNISLTTARNTYEHLEKQGWLVAKPRSGYFVSLPLTNERLPATPSFTGRIQHIEPVQHLWALATNHPFGYSRTQPSWFPESAFRQAMKQACANELTELCRQPHFLGLDKLRQTLSHHWQQSELSIDPNELMITTGCLDAVRLALKSCTKDGDAIAVSSPCFDGLLQVLAQENRRVIELPCTHQGLDLVQLEVLMRSGAIKANLFSSNHLNPLGICLPTEQKRQLAQMAAKYQCPIIEDDVYFELGYLQQPLPIKHWDSSGYVLWCGSMAKSLGEGIRVGWCATGQFKQQAIEVAAPIFSQPALVMQAALSNFINNRQYQRHLSSVRSKLQQNMAEYRQFLLQHLPDTFRISLPEGGTVLWIEAPYPLSNFPFNLRQGSRFTTRQQYQNYCRINFGWALSDEFNGNRLHDDLATLVQALIQQG